MLFITDGFTIRGFDNFSWVYNKIPFFVAIIKKKGNILKRSNVIRIEFPLGEWRKPSRPEGVKG